MLCGLFSLWPLNLFRSRAGEPGNILVILLSEMGSLVLAVPMIDRLKAKYPRASIHALIFERNRDILQTLDVVPPGRILTVRDTSFAAFLGDSLRATRRMRRLRIDTAIDCELFSRVGSILAFLSGAARIAGFHPHTQEGLYRGGYVNCPVLYNPHLHMSRQFINLAEAIDSRDRPRVKRRPAVGPVTVRPVTFTEAELAETRERLIRDFPALDPSRLVLVCPGGGLLPIRAWPAEHFARVCEALSADGYTIAFVGTAQYGEAARRVMSLCTKAACADLTGHTETMGHLLRLMHLASLLITNDGGPGHFAALTPLPAIILYGPETPRLYGSLSPNAHEFFLGLSCSPCLTAYNHRNSPCDGNNVCLKEIGPDDVIAKAREILGVGRE